MRQSIGLALPSDPNEQVNMQVKIHRFQKEPTFKQAGFGL